jgi:hypothetical protein
MRGTGCIDLKRKFQTTSDLRGFYKKMSLVYSFRLTAGFLGKRISALMLRLSPIFEAVDG